MNTATNGIGLRDDFGKYMLESRCDIYLALKEVAERFSGARVELERIEPAIRSDVAKVIGISPHEVDLDCVCQFVRNRSENFLPFDTFNGGDGKEVLRELGGLFRGIRLQKGLSLEAVSDQIGVDLSYLSRFETGQRKWRIALLEDLARELDPSLDLDSIFRVVGISKAEYEREKQQKRR